MAIVVILAAILFPVFAQAREKSRQTVCLSNLRQIGLAISLYTQDYDDALPIGGNRGPTGSNRWYHWIAPYLRSSAISTCPSAPGLTLGDYSAGGYGCNRNLMDWAGFPVHTGPPPSKSLPQIVDPAGTFTICDCSQCTRQVIEKDPETWNAYIDPQRPSCDWQVTPPGAWDRAGYIPYKQHSTWGDESRRPMPRHNLGLSVIYADGHARWNRLTQFLGPMPQGWPYGDPRNSWDNR
jgi:hypothetical protein